MSTSRRRFLSTVALTGAGLAVSRALGPLIPRASASPAAGTALRFPPLFAGGDLVAERTAVSINPDRPTSLLTLGGSFPGPTIRLTRGDELRVRLVNRLDEETNVHWHGLLAPAMMDGHPMHVVAPGESREYRYVVDQRGGTYWYHPHAHMATARQAYLGMAGFFIVDDPAEAALGLPSGERDVPLVLQDRRVGAGREITYAPTMMDTMSGVLGSTLLVNGTPEPYLEVSRDLYRLRLLNGSNARIYRLGLADGAAFHLIATDGGLIDRPREITELWLAPGERAEILVDFSNRAIGTSVMFRSLQYDNALSPNFQGYAFDVVRFDVTRAASADATMPATLSTIERLVIGPTTRTRTLRLAMQHGPGMSMSHVINGRAYDMHRVDERVVAGSTEVWELVNNDNDDPHPMHLHGAQFQVLDRNGSAELEPKDLGWKDTVLVDPIETVRVAVRFGDETGMFVAHCHNLEHEDSGMMMNVMIESGAGAGGDAVEHGLAIEAVMPNPASEVARVAYALETGGVVEIALFDVVGRRIRTTRLGEQPRGAHAVDLDVSALAEGSYLLRVSCGPRSVERALRIVR